MKHLLLFLSFQLLFLSAVRANMDSTGVKKINGKFFIIYKVEKGQGLYSIAKRYGTSVSSIQEANKEMGLTLSVGQEILVPYDKIEKTKTAVNKHPVKTTQSKEQTEDYQEGKEPIYHTVLKKETLYQIAINHNITVEQIKAWNKMVNNELKAGRKIIVGYREDNNSHTNSENLAKTKTGADKKSKREKKKIADDEDERTNVNTIKKEVKESGMATWVDDGSIKSDVHLAIHKSAPEGTLIKVTNPMNGRYRYVKVVGNLPDNDENKNILIKIDKNTADELDIRDKVFRVDISWSKDVGK